MKRWEDGSSSSSSKKFLILKKAAENADFSCPPERRLLGAMKLALVEGIEVGFPICPNHLPRVTSQ
jgi:hypothetical protein